MKRFVRLILPFFLFIFLLIACNSNQKVIEAIEFETEYKLSSEIEEEVERDTMPWKYQFSAAAYATKGDYKNALRHWDLAMRGRNRTYTESQVDSINQKYQKVAALDYIIEQSKENQVIIINEAHHNSFHRVFTKALLQKLYEEGYTNLGLEALGNGEFLDSTLNERKYPVQETGFYTKDPQFGNLIREALEIGYTLFAYENMGNGGGKPREIAQARNIEKVIKAKPDEKFLIHCGFAHALEGTHRSWEKAMAGRLTEYTGINPLTINQVLYSEKGNPEFNHPLLKALDLKESTILLDENEAPHRYERGEAWTDLAVFHPSTQYVEDRPNWLYAHGNQQVSIPLTEVEMAFPVMVLAYKKGEAIKEAVPVDITEVNDKNQTASLGLKKGVYTIIISNKKKAVKFDYKVK
jgi:hypothetical protein